MFRFEYIEHLYYLVSIPILVIFFIMMWVWHKRSLSKFANSKLWSRLMPNFSKKRHVIKFILLMVALVLLIIGYANPQFGTKRQKIKAKSSDIIIAMDVSRSMLTEDISPNRIDRSKHFVKKLINKLKGDRVGLIVFAGQAYLQMPLTNDYSAAHVFLKSINTEMAPTQGTAIGEAIRLAEDMSGDEDKHSRALVIITDGEDHDGDAVDAAKHAADLGMVVYVVGVGTSKGGPVIEKISSRYMVKKDESGNPIISRLNMDVINEIASGGHGRSFLLNDDKEILELLDKDLERIEKREIEGKMFKEYNSYFQYFIFWAFLFLVFEFLVFYKSKD